MRAMVYAKDGSPDILMSKELPRPTPKDNEVLIRVHAAAVNASDTFSAPGFMRGSYSIPGDVFAGVIEEAGKDVTLFKLGDAVYGTTAPRTGTYVDYVCLPETRALTAKPADLTFAEAAALVDGALTALPFLRDKGDIKSGQSVLINGASGSIGTFAVQYAKYIGATVTGVTSTANIDMVMSLGADKVIDYTTEDFTKAEGTYDIIFDTVAKSSYASCRQALKSKGIYLSTIPKPSVLWQMLKTSITGGRQAKFMATGLRPANQKVKDLIYLNDLVNSNRIKAIIDKTYPLEQAAEAYDYVAKGHKKGNVILNAT